MHTNTTTGQSNTQPLFLAVLTESLHRQRSRSNIDLLHTRDEGYLTVNAKNGPGMNLLYHFNSGDNAFAMVGVGSSPSIDSKLTSGTSATSSYSYGYATSFKIHLQSDNVANAAGDPTYGGTMGLIGFGNATGGSTTGSGSSMLCITSNGFTYFRAASSYWRLPTLLPVWWLIKWCSILYLGWMGSRNGILRLNGRLRRRHLQDWRCQAIA